MRIICAGDTGVIKIVEPESSKVLNRIGQQDATHSIKSMVWADPGNEGEFVVARKNKSIESYFPTNGEKRFSFESTHVPKGIYSFNKGEKRSTLICSQDGKLEICEFPLKAKEVDREMTSSIYNVVAPVSCFRVFKDLNTTSRVYAVGGQDNLMKIYDLETQKLIYKAKNVKNDFLNLRQPIYVSDIAFCGDGNVVCNSTFYHQVRVHDRRAGNKPITQKSWGEHAYTRMIPSPLSEKEVIVGMVEGSVFRFNFENLTRKRLVVYKGSAGSIRDFSYHPNMGVFASVGADRHVRVWDTIKRKELFKTYLTQRQNAVLFTSDAKSVAPESDEEEGPTGVSDEGEEDVEDPWETLDSMENEQAKKKKKPLTSDEENESENDEHSENSEEGESDDIDEDDEDDESD